MFIHVTNIYEINLKITLKYLIKTIFNYNFLYAKFHLKRKRYLFNFTLDVTTKKCVGCFKLFCSKKSFSCRHKKTDLRLLRIYNMKDEDVI